MASPYRYLWEMGTTDDGNYIGVSATDKIGLYGTTPVVQQSTAASATDLATAITLVNALKDACDNIGLTA
jgi:hypothetical protein